MREAIDRYSGVSILLHWLIAALLIANVVIAFTMEDMPGLFVWHKSIGISVLLLTLVRIVWRLTHPWPPLPEGIAPWERATARLTHVGFYMLLIMVPLLGWATVSAGSRGTGTLLGGIPWFDLPVGTSRDLQGAFGEAHELAAFLTLALVALHVAGALKHHFVDRNGLLRRMLPGR
ncbi:cytochrome b [Sphingomonas suaedae]|uniref:Cytochrome b n=1 Tax=Sphingomonas suaedae TaxID=2599297 RepID=A0A518RHA0_9SPHN|nr:cytochrome b [Sphingomonas suaedae]QDX26843.1 cytochrome b [Sphingomonas suaedae]